MFITNFRRGPSVLQQEAFCASGANQLKSRITDDPTCRTGIPCRTAQMLVLALLFMTGVLPGMETHLRAQTPVTAVDDLSSFASEDATIPFTVLANDLGDIDSATLSVLTPPSNGVAVADPLNGLIYYTPDANYFGPDAFRYIVADTMGGTDSALVSFFVWGLNDPPVINPDADSLLNSSMVVINPLANDNDSLDIIGSIAPSTLSIVTPPANGFATENLATGEITYSPFLGFFGIDSLEYQVCDNGIPLPPACGTAWIYFTVIDSIEVNDDVTICEGDSVQLLVTGIGPFSWSPAADLSCSDCANPWVSPAVTTTYTVFSDAGGCCPHSVDVTVFVNVADTAIAFGDSVTVAEEGTVAFDVLSNDFFLDSASVSIISGPSSGSLSLSAGVASYTADPDTWGVDSFYYLVCSEGCPTPCDTGLALINVIPANDPPIALDDVLNTLEDTPGSVAILSNDSDVDGNLDTTSLVIITPPSNGVASFDPLTGLITYTPDPDYNGPDQLTYVICDDGTPLPSECDTAILFITVTPVNDPPVALNDSLIIVEDSTGTVDLDANDTDVEGPLDPANITVLSGPFNGSAVLDPATGVATYTPDPDYNGLDSFQYEICDGSPGLCDTAWVVITVIPVNDPPVAVDDVLVLVEDNTGTSAVLSNDSDVDGNLDTTSLVIITPPSNGVASFDPLTGLITYTPDPDYNGPDQLTYVICDDGTPLPSECDTAILFITVTPVNDPPVAADDFVTIDEDSFAVVDVLANDFDTEGLDPATVGVISGPDNGTVSVDPVTGAITYTPNPDYYGTDSFQYVVCDIGPAVICDTATVVITVNPINDPPVAVDDFSTTPDDTPVVIEVADNDTDVDGTPLLSTISITSGPSTGSVTVDPDSGEVTYTPLVGFTGVDSFQYAICDDGFPLPSLCDTAWVVVNISLSFNDPPLAAVDSMEVWEDSLGTVDVVANDTDPEGLLDPTSVSLVGGPFNGSVLIDTITGLVTYIPDPDFYGADSFQYSICDLGIPTACDQAWVIVNVLPINDTLILVDDLVSTNEEIPVAIDVLANDSDIDGSIVPFSVTPFSAPANGTLAVDPFTGIITYTPDPGFTGVDSFSYFACDDGFPTPSTCGEAWVFVTVLPVPPPNTAPVAAADSFIVWEDSLSVLDVLANDTDLVGSIDPATVTIATAPANGSVSVDPVSGEITYTPDPDYFGADSFQYSICDDGSPVLCADAWVLIEVLPVNDAPIALDDVASTTEDVAVIVDVLANDTDVDGSPDPATVLVDIAPLFGSASADPITGEIVYTPLAGFSGVDSFSYVVCDDGFPLPSLCDTAWVVITVAPVPLLNLTPVALDDSVTVWEDSLAVVAVLTNDFDPDGILDTGSLVLSSSPANGFAVVDLLTGEIIYTPNPDYYGPDSFSYTVCDTATPPLCATAWVIIDVEPVNDAPVALNDSVSGELDTTAVVDVLANDTDVDGNLDTASLVILTEPIDGTASVDSVTGEITYTPDPGFTGVDSVQYLICDDGAPLPAMCDSAWLVVTVIPPVGSNAKIIAVNDTIDLFEDVVELIAVLANDIDPENNIDTASILILDAPLSGSAVADPATGLITYTPDADFWGSDSFRYQISDGDAPVSSADAWVILRVLAVEDPPLAVDDTGAVALDESILMDVLANDFDPEGGLDSASLTLLSPPGNGSISQEGYAYLYTPDEGWCGTDSFQYFICDAAGLCDDAWVFVEVDCGAIEDFYATDDVVNTPYGETVIVNVLSNDDPRASAACVELVTEPLHGMAMLETDGRISYQPDPGFFGIDCFRYSVCDSTGLLSDDAFVCVEVGFQDLVVSTGMSPNGDGSNDSWVILGIERYENAEVSVFNRWGNLVFRDAGYDNDWDGTRKGRSLPAGTYFYVIRLEPEQPDGAILKGSLTLRR